MAYDPWGTWKQNIGRQITTTGTLLKAPEMKVGEKFGVTGKFGEKAYAAEPDPLTQVVLNTQTNKPTTSFGDLNKPSRNTSNQPPPSSAGGRGPQQILDDMNAGRISWDDNLRAWANGQLSGSGSGPNVEELRRQQEEAAKAAAEAKRQGAMRSYQGKVQIAGSAKEQAKGEYDWLVDTLGSNKKDLLTQVALNEQEGLTGYQQQEAKTKTQYDGAKQEILSTYRDLGRQQEKLMRGTGLQSSSRMMEAQNRLNALMGKDLSGVTTNEADAIAMIGNATSAMKNRTIESKNSIETEAKSKLDKAALDYNGQVKAIDNNLYLSANEREDAYAAAEATLADDTAKISTWAAGLKSQVEMQKMQLKMQLDQFVMAMTDSKGLLTQGLSEKLNATNDFLSKARYTPLDTETGAQQAGGQGGGYKPTQKTYASKEALDAALQSGELTPMEYSAQLNKLAMAPTGPVSTQDPLMAALMSGPTANSSATLRVQSDPLLAALFAGK